LKGNDFRLKQLFQNLIQNALKYNDKEHIKLRSQVPKRQEYLFQIKDNGIGIPKAYQQKIFYFSKLQNDDSSGIGLSIVKKNNRFYKGKFA
jgi:signal transduction histidine kinase